MRVLVTGGAGFIGGHVAESLAGDGHDVTVLDNFDPYYDPGIKAQNVEAARRAAEEGDGRYELVEGSVTDTSLVADLVAPVDVVFHHAAQAGVRTSVENPRKPDRVNVDGTLSVLEAARAGDVERVVNASSSSVYGDPEYLPYDEDHPTSPVSPYGVTKLAGEHYARVYDGIRDLPTVSLRYFTVYGPRMRPNMAISNFVSRCLDGEPPVVHGDGTQTRDFTHVDDVVDVNRTLLQEDAADGEVVNVGSTDPIEIRSLAELVCDRIDPSLDVEFSDRPAGDVEHTHADVSKARDLLDYEPTLDVRRGVGRFIEWYRGNREWYEPLVNAS